MASFVNLCRRERARLRRLLGRRRARPSSITSSARTSSTSTRCSGRRCSTARASARRPASSCTASSPSTARRCPSRAAPSSPRRTFPEHLDPEYLRYYFAAKLGPGLDDIDLNLDDFVARVNSDLVGKFVNIASRCAGFVHQPGGGRLAASAAGRRALRASSRAAATDIAAAYEQREYCARDARDHGARRPRQPVHRRAQAVAAREGSGASAPKCMAVCTQGLNLFRMLVSISSRCCRRWPTRPRRFLGGRRLALGRRRHAAARPRIGPSSRCSAGRSAATDAIVAEARAAPAGADRPQATATARMRNDDRHRALLKTIDLRVARVLEAEPRRGRGQVACVSHLTSAARRVPCSRASAARTIRRPSSGVSWSWWPIWRPRKMRFGVSEGMVLAAGADGEGVFVLEPGRAARSRA